MKDKNEDNTENKIILKNHNSSMKKVEDKDKDKNLTVNLGNRIKDRVSIFQQGKGKVLSQPKAYSGISHSESFQSKLLFFNGGKPLKKFQPIPFETEDIEERDCKRRKYAMVKTVTRCNRYKHVNINNNKMFESKNSDNISNKIKNENDKTTKKDKPRNTDFIGYETNPNYYAISFGIASKDKKNQSNEKKIEDKNESPIKDKPKVMKDQWAFLKLSLDDNIFDFSSKTNFYNFKCSDN